MKNPRVQFVIVTMALICVGVLLISSMTQAEPKGIPWQDKGEQREGYSRSFVVDGNSILLEVPEGKCYVLLRLYARYVDYEPPHFDNWGEGEDDSAWSLTIDGELFFNEFILDDTTANTCCIVREDFPDKCVVVSGGETLWIIKHENVEQVQMSLIGYFRDMR